MTSPTLLEERLIQEINTLPDDLVVEVIDFNTVIKSQQPQRSSRHQSLLAFITWIKSRQSRQQQSDIFVQALLNVRQELIQDIQAEKGASTREERLAYSQKARGRFAHLPNSSDAFAQRKQAEIDWEDRNR
ncbi:hypothetical protein [Trichothermofontia sp.]